MPVQKTLPVNNVYNMNDIATYFTLLVGIYFPSVTGEFITPLKAQHVTLQPSIHYRLKKKKKIHVYVLLNQRYKIIITVASKKWK